ncbi:Disrupted in renal carcinoma protein 2-like protein [Armadillidium nasatum]|uniref:Disrupted in renal carcinoma protein 2-like protein n=1 Tax=Armadillidium nasatum TaxID=96803 RepID=A0A5N5T2A7_9CRUS|nr:Disrupted in renal carcinoma protein 2-like protein [Armadillidium nasatum]
MSSRDSLISQRERTITDQDSIAFPVAVKVYKRRWYILFIFAGLGFMQCAVWNTWGPITQAAKAAYPDWDDAEIGLLSMWGTITMIIGLVPFTIMLQTKGLRYSIVITSGLLAAASAVRLLATEELAFTIFAHIGALLNGFAGIIIGCAPSLLSSTWFPPNERTTATGIGCTFNQLGNAGGFFLGPLIVQDPTNKSNISFPANTDTDMIRRSIRDYMWISAALCVPLFLFVLAYFPDKPKHPPSLTSAIHQTDTTIKEEISMIVRNKNFWMLMVPYSLTIGLNVAWSSVLDINLEPVGIDQNEASLVGIYMTFGGVVLAITASRFTDLLFGYIKVTIIGLLLVSTTMFGWFLFTMNGMLPFGKVQLYVSSVLGASFSYACSPLFFELAVEISYPVSEGIIGGFLTFFWNITAVVFLALLQLRMDSVIWMDYLLFIQGIISIIFMLFLKEEYNRTSLDKTENITVRVTEEGDDDDDIESGILRDIFRSNSILRSHRQ